MLPGPSNNMSLSIIIVNWNGGALLLRCLDSIRASSTTFPVRVIVVDNDSTDGSREAAQARFPEYDIFNSGSNLGFGRANNLARDRVRTPLVLILNPDTELKSDTLQRMVQLMESRPEVGAATCMMRYPNGDVQELGLQWSPSPITVFLELLLANRMVRRLFRWCLPAVDPHSSGYVRKIYGGFVIARKEVLDEAGWFDDRYFMYAEDVDLSRTIRQLDWKLYYNSAAEIVHVCGGLSDQAPSGFSVLMKNESIAKYIRKYQGRISELFYRFTIFSAALIRLLISLPFHLFHIGNSVRWKNALLKQKLMILWAVGLKRAVIATSRATHDPSLKRTTTHPSPPEALGTVSTAN